MKSDLDHLMEARGFDALIVNGTTAGNPVMNYLSNGAHVGESTLLVKKRGEAPVMIVASIERDEAAKSGLQVIEWSKYNPLKSLNEEKGNRLRATVRNYHEIFVDLGVRGAVALYGRQEQGRAMALAQEFNAGPNGARLVGEFADTIFDMAWTTKDAVEVERIRAVGRKTVTVIGSTAEFLQSHRAANGALVKKDGSPLTIGDVKREIRRWEMELNLEDQDGAIFAIGRDAGVPHSHGEDSAPIALGKTIVYDIFPREPGGGYHFDITRTWCVGFAPPEAERAYRDVMDVHAIMMSEMKVNDLCRPHQQRVCELFEARGHPTIGKDPKTNQGYIHSLGHGVGLNIHERPHFSDFEGNPDRLVPGCVVTVEPGLYYPDDGGYGVRIEDCVWVNPATGHFDVLAAYPKDLVLPVKRASARRAKAASRKQASKIKAQASRLKSQAVRLQKQAAKIKARAVRAGARRRTAAKPARRAR